jgi:hypothetical protein
MASNTRETWKKRLRRKAKAGRKRKNQEGRHSTPSSAQLFAGMGEPGQAAPKAPAKPAKPPTKSPTTSGAAAR